MGEETDEYVTSSSKLRDTIKAYTGFDILNEAGDGYKDLYEIVLGIGKQWKNLGDLEKAALGEALGGKRNARGLFAIFDNLDILEGAYETSVNSAGSAMQEQEHYAESVQYSIDRTKASLEELAHDFLSSDLLKGLIEGANTFLQKVDEIISKLGTVGTVIAGITGASTVRGLFTNEGLVAGGIKALTNRQFGEANQRRSMWGNIRQLIGLDEPVYDVEGAKTAMSVNATEEFKDAAAKENTAGASATKTAAIEAETAAMEANTQAIQQNTAAENGDTLSEKAHEIMDDESYQETYANAIDFDDTIKEAGTDAGSEYAQNFTQAQMDMMNDNSFQEIQDLMTENLDDVIDPGQMFESGSNAGEALGEGISENMRKAMMDDDVSDILADQFEDSFDVSQVMDIGENISDALASGVSGTGEVLIDEFQNAGEALRDSEILTRSAIRTATQDAMAESAAVLERTAEPAASGFVAKFTAGLSGIGGKVGAILTSINPVMLAGGAALGILLGKSIYDAYQNYLIKTASTATDNFVDKKELINNYKDRYTELSKQLTDGNLSDAERVQVRQQLIDLQRQLNSELGAEASGIDLVNGKLEEQLAKLGQVTEEQAKQNLDDPAVQKAYEKAASKMTDENTYNLGQIFDASNGSLGRELIDSIKKDLKGVGGKLNEVIDSEGFTKLEFTGDVTQAQKAIEQIDNSLEDFQKKHRGTKEEEYANSIVQNIKESMQFSRNDVEETIGKYQDNYKSYLEQEFYNDDNIKKANKTLLSDMSKSVNDLNTAIASGDTEQFNATLDKFKELETISNGKEFEPYKEIFDDITSNIDKAGQSAMEFKDLLDDNGAGKNNPLKDDADEYVKAVEDLKNEGLQAIDLEDLDLHPEKATQGLKKIGEAFDIAFDGTEEDNAKIQTMISTLTELGIISDSVADAIEGKTEDSFDSFRSSIINDIANIDTLNAAIAESFTGKGLSYSIDESTGEIVGSVKTIKDAYADLMGDEYDSSKLFEHTANGIHLNMEEMRKLRSEQEAANKSRFLQERLKAENDVLDLERKISEYGESRHLQDNYDLDALNSQLKEAKEHLTNVKDLQAAYDGATSAYQKWTEAQSAGEEGDMYNTIRDTALKRGKELYDAGLYGTNEFRSIAQMFSYEDLSTANITDIISAYENGTKAVGKFFKEGREGWEGFATYLKDLGPEFGSVSGDVYEGFSFFGTNIDKIAEKLGVSRDIVESIFKRMIDYGGNYRFFDANQEAELRNIKSNVDGIQSSLKETEDFHINVNGVEKDFSEVFDFDLTEIGLDADALNEKLAELSAAKFDPDISDEQLVLVNDLIEQIKQNLDIINNSHSSPDGPNLETWKTAQSLLQQFEQEMQTLDTANADPSVDLSITSSPEAMQIVDMFMNDPDLAAMAHIDISKGKDDVISQLEAMHKNGTAITVDEKIGEKLPESEKNQEGELHLKTEADQLPEEQKKQVGILELTPTVAKNAQKRIQKLKGTTETSTKKETVEKTETTTSTKNENTNITVTGNYDDAVKIRTAIASIPDSKTVKIVVDTGNAITGINRVVARVEAIKDKEVKITANDGAAITKINTINRMPINPKSLTISHNLDAVSTKLNTIISKLAAIKDKNVTVRVNHVSAGNASANPTTGANGTAHWQGTAGGYYSPKRRGSVGNSFINHYNGTAHARGNWGLKRDEPNALINELGPEIVVLCKLCYHVWRHACKITSNC